MSHVTPVGLDDGRRSLVRSTVIDSGSTVGLATIVMVATVLLVPQHTDVIVKGYLAAVGLLLGLIAINRIASFVYGRPTSRGTGRAANDAVSNRPAALLDIENRVSFAKVSAFDYQGRLRPLLLDIAEQRLDANWHVDLHQEPAAAQARLGSELWNAIQGPGGVTDPRDQPGMTVPRLRAIVDGLESI